MHELRTTTSRFPFQVKATAKEATNALQESNGKMMGTCPFFLLGSSTMATPGPSKLQIPAALDLPEDASSVPIHLSSWQAGEKRKRDAEYAADASLNKRRACGTPCAVISRIPASLLVSSQYPGAYLFFIRDVDAYLGPAVPTARCRGDCQ
jgi:hypothetical protein